MIPSEPKPRSWFKILGAAMLGLAALFVLLGLMTLILMPHPRDLLGLPRSPRTSTAAPTGADVAASAASTAAPQETAGATPAPVDAKLAAREQAARTQTVFMDKYVRSETFESNVCENLSGMAAREPVKNWSGFAQSLNQTIVSSGAERAADVEAVMMPIEWTLKSKSIRELIQWTIDETARIPSDETLAGLQTKAQFLYLATKAASDLVDRQDDIDRVFNQSHLLYALARAVKAKPETLSDPELEVFCRRIQGAVTEREYAVFEDHEIQMQQFLERHAIEPAQIGYHPALSLGVSVVRDSSGVRLRVPWLDRAMGSATNGAAPSAPAGTPAPSSIN